MRFFYHISMRKRGPEVESQGEFEAAFLPRRVDLAGRVAVFLKPRQPPRLRLVGIDRLGFVSATAGMDDVIDTASQRQTIPGIDNVERQRRMHWNGRVQARGRLPRLEADA